MIRKNDKLWNDQGIPGRDLVQFLILEIWPSPEHAILSSNIVHKTLFVIDKINIWQPDFWGKVSINVQWTIEIVKRKSWIFPSLAKIYGLLWAFVFCCPWLQLIALGPVWRPGPVGNPYQLRKWRLYQRHRCQFWHRQGYQYQNKGAVEYHNY